MKQQINILKCLIVLICILTGTFNVAAQDNPNLPFSCDGIRYKITSDSTVTVYEGYNPYSGEVNIPSTIYYNNKTYSVTGIDEWAFKSCAGLTGVTIPGSVRYIGRRAFEACIGLTSVTIPNSVRSIGESAFSDCTSLTSVTIPNSITSIGQNTFYNCRKLKSITIPYPVTNIGVNAFYYCEDLTDVTCLAVTPPSMGDYTTIYPAYYMATLHVLEKSVEAYRATDWWSHFIDIVGDASEDGTIPNTPATDKCDTNDDGEVNIADVNRVIDAILSH